MVFQTDFCLFVVFYSTILPQARYLPGILNKHTYLLKCKSYHGAYCYCNGKPYFPIYVHPYSTTLPQAIDFYLHTLLFNCAMMTLDLQNLRAYSARKTRKNFLFHHVQVTEALNTVTEAQSNQFWKQFSLHLLQDTLWSVWEVFGFSDSLVAPLILLEHKFLTITHFTLWGI